MRRRFSDVSRNSDAELLEASLSAVTVLEEVLLLSSDGSKSLGFEELRENLEELRLRAQRREVTK